MFVLYESLFIRFFHTDYNYGFLVQEYFSMKILIVVISVNKWTSRNRTTMDIDENSFYVFIALHEMISIFMKLHISKI